VHREVLTKLFSQEIHPILLTAPVRRLYATFGLTIEYLPHASRPPNGRILLQPLRAFMADN
jgi:hypothetical protein